MCLTRYLSMLIEKGKIKSETSGSLQRVKALVLSHPHSCGIGPLDLCTLPFAITNGKLPIANSH